MVCSRRRSARRRSMKRSRFSGTWTRSASTRQISDYPGPDRRSRRMGKSPAGATLVGDTPPIGEIKQRTGVPIECCTFIGSSPIRQYAEGWSLDYLRTCTERAISFAVNEGLQVMYVTEDTTRADPEQLRLLYTAAVKAG